MWDWMLSSFPTAALLGCISLACPDLAADRCPDSNTYKTHLYISWLKQYIYSNGYINPQISFILQLQIQLILMITHFQYHTGELKGPAGPTFFCQAQSPCSQHFFDALNTPRSTRLFGTKILYSDMNTRGIAKLSRRTVSINPLVLF
jgi:hypothetical protein